MPLLYLLFCPREEGRKRVWLLFFFLDWLKGLLQSFGEPPGFHDILLRESHQFVSFGGIDPFQRAIAVLGKVDGWIL